MINEIPANKNVIPEIDSAQMSYTADRFKMQFTCNALYRFGPLYIGLDLFRKYEKRNEHPGQRLDPRVCVQRFV